MAVPYPADPVIVSARLRAEYADLPEYSVSQAVAAAYVAADALGAGAALTQTRLETLARERLDMMRRRLAAPAHPAGAPVPATTETAGDLHLTTLTDDDRTVVAIRGEVDVHTAPRLRAYFVDLVNSGCHHLVVDLDGVGFIDSTGLGVLVGVLKRVRGEGGSLRLVFTHERILKIFRITGLNNVFSVHASIAEATASQRDERRHAPISALEAG